MKPPFVFPVVKPFDNQGYDPLIIAGNGIYQTV